LLGLGTDFFGTDDLPQGIRGYADLYILADKLSKRGYSDGDIDGLFGGNYRRFLFNE
jgi:membrane dipeptidase